MKSIIFRDMKIKLCVYTARTVTTCINTTEGKWESKNNPEMTEE